MSAKKVGKGLEMWHSKYKPKVMFLTTVLGCQLGNPFDIVALQMLVGGTAELTSLLFVM